MDNRRIKGFLERHFWSPKKKEWRRFIAVSFAGIFPENFRAKFMGFPSVFFDLPVKKKTKTSHPTNLFSLTLDLFSDFTSVS